MLRGIKWMIKMISNKDVVNQGSGVGVVTGSMVVGVPGESSGASVGTNGHSGENSLPEGHFFTFFREEITFSL